MNILSYTLFALLSITAVHTAHARDIFIALSPHGAPERSREQIIDTLKFSSQLEPEDRVIYIDGFNHTLLGTFEIPADTTYSHPKARLAANKSTVVALMTFAAQADTQTATAPQVSQALQIPQTLRFIAENFDAASGTDIVLLGSPLHDDPRDPAFSMANGHVPSDGHLAATPATTPYGIAGAQERLSGYRVHFVYEGDSGIRSDYHRHFVQRFWTLFVEGQGGVLAGFVGDMATLFEHIDSAAEGIPHNFERDASVKLEMISHQPVVLRTTESIFDRTVSTSTPSVAQVGTASGLEIGISWDCVDCDLDLYARPLPGAAVLSFKNTETPEGRYWKDFRNSPRAVNGHETIAFSVPVDLRSTFIAVNFYGGDAPEGVSVEVRIALDGHTYAAMYYIAAIRGNGGLTDAVLDTGVSDSSATLVIDPLAVLGLNR